MDFYYENLCRQEGYSILAGMDEVGRGPLAGPVLACALILPDGFDIEGVNDSKKIAPGKREKLYQAIKDIALEIGIGLVEADEIDSINILKATHKAMAVALANLCTVPDCVLVDGGFVPTIKMPQKAIKGGDAKSISIAAASIVAKVTRDNLMLEYHNVYPAYGFNAHKGYGTKQHIQAIKQHGLCPIHRKTFVKEEYL